MKLQWSIQPRHTQLALDHLTHLNYRSMHIWPPTRLDNITWSFTFNSIFFFLVISLDLFYLFETITSYCENDFWYFSFMEQPLAFWRIIHFIFWSLSLFPSPILVCATGFCSSISLFIWRFTFGELLLAKTKNKEWEDIYMHKSMHVSRSTKTIH